MSREKPQAETLDKHPEQYQQDLNPDAMAGQNIGLGEADPAKFARTAHDLKPLHRRFRDISDDDLKQIPVLPEGSRLQQGATYFDLEDPDRGEFTAMGYMKAGRHNWYVAKDDVPYELWNRLKRV
jgi:hypothetical protein